jgi:hypothetical protein
MPHWKDRLRASGIHLGICLLIAALAGMLVFVLWYPYPYREISGGRELFLLVVSVDVVLGPLITLAIFNRKKAWPVLRRDLVVVGLLQLAGLGYGLWTVYVARPVHLVFEYNRFRVVHAIEVPPQMLDKTPPGIAALPMWGPTLLSLRPFRNNAEQADATLADIAGMPLATRPDLWQSYEAGKADVIKEAKPVSRLKARFPAQAAAIDKILQSTGRTADTLAWVPMIGRKTFWTVFVDPASAQVLAFLPLDSF